ncbi:hypothetical protein [Cytobacillus pseudoceanisediminis]|uniref:hypothetical protein n=1 Tax=Cytobacillus pseudoceanisediminis TaxID=3051614 RepID=UPI003CF2A1CE
MSEWTKDSLRKQLFELMSDGKKVNPQSVGNIEGFYSAAKKLFGSYEEFLLEHGLNPAVCFHRNRNLNSIKSATGLLFEEVLGDLLADLKLNVIQETVNGCRPDFIVRTPVSEKWIDAKLTELTALRSKSISKYVGHCDKLILVYLIGDDKDYNITDKVRVVSVNKFIDMLPSAESKEAYRKRLKLIVKIADAADKEIKDFGETVDYAEVI